MALQHCLAEAAKARHFKWEISNMFWSPDCEEKVVLGTNGQFPGPTMCVRAGDTLHVHLKNALHTEGVPICKCFVTHREARHQTDRDAVGGRHGGDLPVRHQRNPEGIFTYGFVVDKPETYFYHRHYGTQRAAGLYGSLIVDVAEGEEDSFKYNGEVNLQLSDGYHETIALSSNGGREGTAAGERGVQMEADIDEEMKEGIQEAPSSRNDDGGHQEVQSIMPSKMVTMMESCRKAWQWLKLKIHQVVNKDSTALKEQKKLWANYAMKSLLFTISTFSAFAYQNQSTPAFSLGNRLFLVAIFVSIVVDAALIILLPPRSDVLVFISWVFLEAASSLIVLSLNKHYALAILAVVLVILLIALLQPKLKPLVEKYCGTSSSSGDTEDIKDEENQNLGNLFDLAQGIANCGGLVTAIFGHYMVGPVTPVGFFFFCSIALALYIMMVITVKAVDRPHVTCLAIVLMVLLLITLTTITIPFACRCGRNPEVVKYSHHRKTLDML